MAANKFPIFINQGAIFTTKNRLVSAERSRNLLQKKLDGLSRKLRDISAELHRTRSYLPEILRDAWFSLAEVKYVISDVNNIVLESVQTARIKVQLRDKENFEISEENFQNFEYLGLAGGRKQVQRLQEIYRIVITHVVKIASLQRSFLISTEILKNVTRHVNALRHAIIPRFEQTLCYISSELDEHEREELFRLKKVKKKKRIGFFVKNNHVERQNIFAEDEDVLF